jgi:hypothetical protein
MGKRGRFILNLSLNNRDSDLLRCCAADDLTCEKVRVRLCSMHQSALPLELSAPFSLTKSEYVCAVPLLSLMDFRNVPRCLVSPFSSTLLLQEIVEQTLPPHPIKPYNMAGTTNSSLSLRTVVVITFKNRLHGSG